LARNGDRESIPKVHYDNPMPTATRLNPPVVSGMKPTLCSIEPPSSAAGTANTATEATRALACRALKSAAVWKRWVVISSTPATLNIIKPPPILAPYKQIGRAHV